MDTNRTRMLVAAGAVVAALGLGALAPVAAQEEGEAGDRRPGPLAGLVADGTITEAQADAIRERVREHREDRPGRGHRGARLLRGALQTSAEAIGIEPDALRERLRAGESIAEVAESEGVERQAVVDALVAAGTERLDAAVADDRISQERADAVAARLPDAAARLVDRQPPPR